MRSEEAGRSMIWHGLLLFLLGLLTGVVIPALTSPRLGLSAHMEGLLNGMFLVVVGGVVWKELKLPDRPARAVFWLLLFAAYANWVFCFLAAVFGASEILSIAGAGYRAAAWQEQLVSVGLGLGAVSILLASMLLLYGLRSLRQSDVAARIGVWTATVNYWEKNRFNPEVRFVPMIRRLLGLRPVRAAA